MKKSSEKGSSGIHQTEETSLLPVAVSTSMAAAPLSANLVSGPIIHRSKSVSGISNVSSYGAGNGSSGGSGSDSASLPALISGAGERAIESFVNFFTAEIPNENTRRAYLTAWREFGIKDARRENECFTCF